MKSQALLTLAESDCLYAKPTQIPAVLLERALVLVGSEGYWLVTWSLVGQLSGHEFCYCSRCGEARLMKPTGLKSEDLKQYTDDPPAAHPYCKMTPGCRGHMVRILKRPVMTKRIRELLETHINGESHADKG
jgi:hypothetical protein